MTSQQASSEFGNRRAAVEAGLAELPRPERSFDSDTTAPALPEVVDAIAAANAGHAASYGADPLTREVIARFRTAIADDSAVVRLCYSGTGANMMAAGLGARGRLVVAEQSHIANDEEGGPAQLSRADLVTVRAPEGRIEPPDLQRVLAAGPALVAVTEASEDGTVYGLARLQALADIVHAHGSLLMVDGARLAHALMSGGMSLADVWATGVDHVVVGGTKVGLLGAEAVLSRSGDPGWWRRSGQLPAKSRFLAAQWAAVFPERWMAAAATANARAADLVAALAAHDLQPALPVEANIVFLDIDPAAAEAFAAWAPLSPWEPPGRVRLVASWDTQPADIEGLVHGLATAVQVAG